MKLDEADKQRVISWISEKCGQMRCTCCGMGQWTLVDISTLSIGHNLHTTRFHYHEGVTQVTLICNNCGHMVFFSPALIGFRPDLPPQVPAEKQPSN